MFFRSKKIIEDHPTITTEENNAFSNRKIVGAVEPYISDMQQDVQGMLARHNELVRKVEGIQIIVDEWATKNLDEQDLVDMLREIITLFKHLKKKKI